MWDIAVFEIAMLCKFELRLLTIVTDFMSICNDHRSVTLLRDRSFA